MKAPPFAVALALLTMSAAPLAAENETPAATSLPSLSLPQSTDDCLKMMETVLERALQADLLDDQIESAESMLARMEEDCLDKRFAEALDAARSVERLVASNK